MKETIRNETVTALGTFAYLEVQVLRKILVEKGIASQEEINQLRNKIIENLAQDETDPEIARIFQIMAKEIAPPPE